MVIIVDSPDRENEGDLCMAAEFVTAGDINFMARHGRGLICLTLTPERCDELELRPMVPNNETPYGTAFTVSIEAREGIATGISAADRAHTIRVAVDPAKGSHDLIHPGHVFPLRARPGGVLERTGQTEASVDLARLAGCRPAGVICEVMKEDGTMARVPDLVLFCAEHGIAMITVADLIDYRRRTEKLVERMAAASLPTAYGDFQAIGYVSKTDGKHHLALVYGDVDGQPDVLVRVHSECVTGDVFHSLRCDCGEQLDQALRHIVQPGPRRAAVPGAGGPRHRPPEQAARLRAAGAGPRHGRGERRARVRARPARVRHRVADPGRPGPVDDPDPDQQPAQDPGPRGLRPDRHRAGRRSRPRRPSTTWPTCARSATSSAIGCTTST